MPNFPLIFGLLLYVGLFVVLAISIWLSGRPGTRLKWVKRWAYVFVFFPAVLHYVLIFQDSRLRKRSAEIQAVRQAQFDANCAKAGAFVYRAVDDVDGVLFLKGANTRFDSRDKHALDPYGHEFVVDEDLARAMLVSLPADGKSILHIDGSGIPGAKLPALSSTSISPTSRRG